jgi:TRAP-type C4-dicarboxylate transport system permease small subunit
MMSNILMYVCAVLLLVMLFLGMADVAGRYLFNKPIIGTVEIFEVLLPAMVLLSLAYTQQLKAHVTVDLFCSKLPPRPRVIVGIIITGWAIVLFALIAWQGVLSAISYRQMHSIITNIGLPMFLPRILVPVGAVAMCLVLIVDLLHIVDEIKKHG